MRPGGGGRRGCRLILAASALGLMDRWAGRRRLCCGETRVTWTEENVSPSVCPGG